MREFILLALRAKTSPDFSLDNLLKAGRMDLVCRAVANTLWISHAVRKDTILHIAMTGPSAPPKIISFNGSELRGIESHDERTIANIIKTALKKGLGLELNEGKETGPGITIAKKAFETLVKEKKKEGKQIVYLHQKGEDIRDFMKNYNKTKSEKSLIFIFGDLTGLPKNTERLLKRLGAKRVSLGPVTLLASHCPVIVHNELDRKTCNLNL